MTSNGYSWVGNQFVKLTEKQSRLEDIDAFGFAADNVGAETQGVNGYWYGLRQQVSYDQHSQHQDPVYQQESSHLEQLYLQQQQLQQSSHAASRAAELMMSGFVPLSQQNLTETFVQPQQQQYFFSESAVSDVQQQPWEYDYAASAPPPPPQHHPLTDPLLPLQISAAHGQFPPPAPQHPLPSTVSLSQASVESTPAQQTPSESVDCSPPPPTPAPQQAREINAASSSVYFSAEDEKRAKRPQKRPCLEDMQMRTKAAFDTKKVLGFGTFGEVDQAVDRKSGTVVALKFVKTEKEKPVNGVPLTCLREMRLLKRLRHENIVTLMEIITGVPDNQANGNTKGSNFSQGFKAEGLCMVFEYLANDLWGLLQLKSELFNAQAVRSLLGQFLSGVAYMHRERVMHRDLKCANLLVSSKGVLKIADYGMARELLVQDPTSRIRLNLSPNLTTLWYRAPEVILKDPNYSTPSDMWSVGCIFSEMMFRTPTLQGNGDMDQLDKILDLCGVPQRTEAWKPQYKLPLFEGYKRRTPSEGRLWEYCHDYQIDRHPKAYELLERMLTVPPSLRITADDALRDEYFSGWSSGELPQGWNWSGYHEQAVKQIMAEEQRKQNELLLRRGTR